MAFSCDLCGEHDSKHTRRVSLRVGKVTVGSWLMCLHCRTVALIKLAGVERR